MRFEHAGKKNIVEKQKCVGFIIEVPVSSRLITSVQKHCREIDAYEIRMPQTSTDLTVLFRIKIPAHIQ